MCGAIGAPTWFLGLEQSPNGQTFSWILYGLMSTTQMNFSAQKYASHAAAIVIDDVIIIGRRRVYCASTLLGRCLCKRVNVYIITLSCRAYLADICTL